MTFDDILAQIIDLLQRQGRVSYGALKRRFDLDDAYLEDLKDEIIHAQRIATDEDGRILVWTGHVEGTTDTASQPDKTTQRPLAQHDQPMQGVPPPRAARTPEAERRQLTVMFCDLVDSTKLSSQLDPEEYRDLVRAYQEVCTDVIQRYDGHIAQLLGDGLLIYFGYPQAHEDDAQRAVRTGLGIIEAIGALKTRLEQDKGIGLAVRLGIHTGLVVVGEMGSQGRQEQLALGQVPNVCSRIQALAAPNTIAMSDATYRLVQGYFQCQDLGAQALRGVTESMRLYQVLSESGAISRLEVAQLRGLTPLVGRESEVTLLLERWEQVKAGHGHVVLLTGDAGIGKSRLVQMLKEHVTNELHTRWECRSLSYFENTALFPLTDLFQRLLRFQAEDTPDKKLGKLEQDLSQYRLPLEESVPLFAPLLALPVPEHRYPLLNLSPQQQRQKTLETLVAILLELAEHHPVLLIIEDLHWTDPTTLELLNLVIEQTPTASLLVLLTCRPYFQPAWHHRSYLTEITVNRLSQPQIERMVERAAGGKTLPDQVMQLIVEKTDGVPLFVEELTKAILESGSLKEVDEHYELPGSLSTFPIPATLQDSLMARLDRLISAKGIAQLGAVIGRQFSYDVLHVVLQLDNSTLQRELGRLVEAELVYQRGLPPQATYTFKHALIQDAAYESLLRSTRQGYHRRIAEVLEEQFPATAENQPELLAHHYMEAGLIEQAVGYWQRAGEGALQRSAYMEASIHLSKGLDGLKLLPKTDKRDKDELALLMAVASALQVTKGFSSVEVEQVITRALTLCQHVGDSPQQIKILLGLRLMYHLRGELQTAWDLGQQLLSLSDRVDEPKLKVQVCYALGHTSYYLGLFDTARFHLERGIALYNTLPQRSPLVQAELGDLQWSCYPPLAWSLWYAGYPDQSLNRIQEGLVLIQETMNIYGMEYLLSSAAIVYQLCGKWALAREHIERAMTIAQERGFQFRYAWNAILKGWIIANQGNVTDGIEQISQGLDAYKTTGAQVSMPWFLALFATMHGQVGQVQKGLILMAEAMDMMSEVGRCFYEAEVHRLRGELLLAQSPDNAAEAESCFEHAITIAQNQSAKSLELRASTSLARLWQQQGKRQEAHALLAPVYQWFTEGFDTADLQEAKALLDEVA